MQSDKACNIHLNAEISFKRSCFVPDTTAQHCLDGGCRVWVGDLLTVTTTKATSCATSSRMLFVSFFFIFR